ncbi:uncharacterized protein LOC144097000 [Amblyomma americanum]
MSHDATHHDPAAPAQDYSQYAYDQTAYGQTTYGQTAYDYTQATTQALPSKLEGTKPTSENRITAPMVMTCILLTVISLVAILTLLALPLGTAFGFGTETDVPDDADMPRLPSVYPVIRMQTRSPVTATDTSATITPHTTPQSPRRVMDQQPLVCTMGSKTSFAQMFPPDGLCEYVFFDSVEKENRNPLAFPNRWGNDLRIFVAAYAQYNTTAFGIGFAYDKAFTLVRQLNTTNSSLLEPFWRKNIFHFGILDTATRNARQADVELALNVLKALDTHAETQRRLGNPSFIFFAGLVFNDTWNNFYNEKFTNFYKPDLFIAQGHFFYGDNTFSDCRVMAPTVLTRPQGLDNYQHDLTLAADSFTKLSSSGLSMIWALSVTMKGRWTMTLPVQGLDDFLSGCVHNATAPSFGRYSEICRNPNYLQRSYSQAHDAILAVHDTDNLLFAYDNEVGLCRKLCTVKARQSALHFGIAVYDTEYEDFLNSCGAFNKYGAFSRLHAVRRILNYFKTKFQSAPDVAGCRDVVT